MQLLRAEIHVLGGTPACSSLGQAPGNEVFTIYRVHPAQSRLSAKCLLLKPTHQQWLTLALPWAQPGSVEGQLGAQRRMCFGDLGFVEQLDALDDDEYSM